MYDTRLVKARPGEGFTTEEREAIQVAIQAGRARRIRRGASGEEPIVVDDTEERRAILRERGRRAARQPRGEERREAVAL